ncbi:Gx transporter family protein [bacterium]|nr:Gx transporter family protein [bacterium]
MSSRPDSSIRLLNASRRTARIALWTAIGVAIAGIERLLPTPLPWVRLGLANGAALLVLLTMGWTSALFVNLARTAVVALLFGTWASPSFLLSFSGAMVAVLVMALLNWAGGRFIGPVGLSAAGAFFHMLVQFLVATALLVRHTSLLAFAGPSLITAVLSGVLVGLIVQLILTRLPSALLGDGSSTTTSGRKV